MGFCSGRWRQISAQPLTSNLPPDRPPPRVHGLHQPFDLLQIGSWILFALFPALYFIFTFQALAPIPRIVLTVIYCAGIISTVALNVLAAMSHAADPGLADRRTINELLAMDVPEGRTICERCQAIVEMSSKHCRKCHKCVVGFDHHCRWLNNCVGSRNYRTFFRFVTVTMMCMLYQVCISAWQFIETFINPDPYKERLTKSYGQNFPLPVFQVGVGVTGLLGFTTVALLVHLYGFHIMLHIRKQTTYEWIMSRRDWKQQKERLKMQRRLERQMQQLPATPNSRPTLLQKPLDALEAGWQHTPGGDSPPMKEAPQLGTITTPGSAAPHPGIHHDTRRALLEHRNSGLSLDHLHTADSVSITMDQHAGTPIVPPAALPLNHPSALPNSAHPTAPAVAMGSSTSNANSTSTRDELLSHSPSEGHRQLAGHSLNASYGHGSERAVLTLNSPEEEHPLRESEFGGTMEEP